MYLILNNKLCTQRMSKHGRFPPNPVYHENVEAKNKKRTYKIYDKHIF